MINKWVSRGKEARLCHNHNVLVETRRV